MAKGDDKASEAEPRERQTPRIVIVGGGFGGIAAARALRRCNAEIVLIDRRNHHIFQPLLYQVAIETTRPTARINAYPRQRGTQTPAAGLQPGRGS